MKNQNTNSDYEGIDDEELVKRYSLGEGEAVDELMSRYKDYVRSKAGTLFLIGGEEEDLIQEGMIGLLKAVWTYSPDKNSSFYHYAGVCIMSKMYSAIESSKRNKHIPLNTYISLYEEKRTANEGNVTLMDILEDSSESDPETILIGQENAEMIDKEIDRSLSSMEKEILNLHMTGLKYVQIAEILNKTPKQVDNALQRIKGKLRRILGE